MIGFAIKFWTMAPAEGEEGFVIENCNNFIFQDETLSNLLMVADIIKKITSGNADLERLVDSMIKALSPDGYHSADVIPGDFVDIKHEVKTVETTVKIEPSNVDMNNEDAVEDVLAKALKFCDQFVVYPQAAQVFASTGRTERAEKLYKVQR